jgi:ABC-type proline/glycine betaine transport system permease subunit/glycine betaine/choline ABC-type transport system substrate-binding protein
VTRVQTVLTALALLVLTHAASAETRVTIGSKAFAESWILGEALAELARPSAAVDHRRNLGGTEVVWQALTAGSIDIYAEYTGTIAEVILGTPEHASLEELRAALARHGVGMSGPLGFDDGYALAVTKRTAERYGLRSISDLARHPDLHAAFSHEFLGRKDGYPGLAKRYGLALEETRGIQHELSYEALASGQADVTEIYTTDPQIERLGLVLLDDDRAFFTRYEAVLLYRLDLPDRASRAFSAMQRLVGAVDRSRMLHANALLASGQKSPEGAAAWLLRDALGGDAKEGTRTWPRVTSIAKASARHLELVFASLFFAVVLGVPLGVLARQSRTLATVTLSAAGLLQTIPSLALLAFLIPLFGIGVAPALAALLLYSLLPIVRNTYAGLAGIPPALSEAAEAIGLSRRDRLLHVALPLASPMIMAGIKTSAVINVGTATLAALVGAGGLGDAILEGIALRDTPRILEGAVPAAALALLVQWGFGWADRWVVPRGLREDG